MGHIPLSRSAANCFARREYKEIWSEWLPSCKSYEIMGNYNIEMYAPPVKNPDDNYSEIWIPVEKV